MRLLSSLRATLVFLSLTGLLTFSGRSASGQEAQVVGTVVKEIAEGLGEHAAAFGGDEIAEQTAKRLVIEATEVAGNSGGKIAEAQVGRIAACGNEAAIFNLKTLHGQALPLLDDVPSKALPSAVATLVRSGVTRDLESLGSMALKREALAAEMRLPGAGLELAKDFGEEGATAARQLTEDQANSLLETVRPAELRSLPATERTQLLQSLAKHPEAQLANFGIPTGPLVVVAGGIVLWHAADLALAPEEDVYVDADGIAHHKKVPPFAIATRAMPAVAHEIAGLFGWAGISLAAGVSVVLALYVWLHHRRAVHRKQMGSPSPRS